MSILGRLFGRKTPHGEVSHPTMAMVDLKLVGDPELSAAMTRFARNATVDGERAFIEKLQRARFLVPLLTGQTGVPPGREFTSSSPELSGGMNLGSCTSPNGGTHLPLFIDWQTMRTWADHQGGMAHTISGLVFSAADAWNFALSQTRFAGVVVFSNEASVPLPRAFVERLRNTPSAA